MQAQGRPAYGLREGRDRSGFTLVELLVVIAIIAILVSMLMPSLKAARIQAQTVQCGCGMRQMAVAAELYAAEQGQYIPRDYYTGRRYGPSPGVKWSKSVGHVLVQEVLSQYFGGPDFRNIPEIHECTSMDRDGFLAIYFREMEPVRCPAQPPTPHASETVTHPITGATEVIDAQMLSHVVNGYIFGGHKSNTSSAGLTRPEILSSAEGLIWLTDGSEDRALTYLGSHDMWLESHMWYGPSPRMIADDRHAGRAPVTYFDGSVEIRQLASIEFREFKPE